MSEKEEGFSVEELLETPKPSTEPKYSLEELIELIEKKVKIPDLIFDLDSRETATCPFIGNTKGNRSFKYYPETESWNCFHPKCGGGNVVNLYAELKKMSFGEALSAMCKEYKIDFSFTPKTEEEIYIQDKVNEAHEFFAEMCYRQLLANTEMYETLKLKRGFTDETMKELKIGLFDESIKIAMEDKYNKNILFESGFLGKKKVRWIFGKRLVFPYLDMNNKPIYFILRLIPEEPDFAPNAKYIKLGVTEIVEENG